MYKRQHLLRLAGAAAAVGALPPLVRAQSRVTLRFSSSMVADQNAAHFVWYERLQSNLKAAMGDAIHIDYFPNNQLGKESDVVQQVKVGSVDMMVSGSSIFATICPELGMLDLGYLFDNYAHVAKVLDGPTGATLNDMLQKSSGCTILTWASHFGPRSVYTKMPVRSLAEVSSRVEILTHSGEIPVSSVRRWYGQISANDRHDDQMYAVGASWRSHPDSRGAVPQFRSELRALSSVG